MDTRRLHRIRHRNTYTTTTGSMSMNFEIFQSTTEREPRAGNPRVPAYVTYVEITASGRHLGVDSVIDSDEVWSRVTNEYGETVLIE
ncbi:hypothetical protein M199_gp116 [Halogranum tailed virus 1]|uniref:Uncharacterized protein n=1 Tax=Halogranum tailed virus 1 TaxID=1273749 RepID=R4T9E9_9CAUD|nr:hypothetical protein M199_gp116 [Halogranum tailed virus 1]AGM11550.1 hypothetical protein HGTV1_253 [Halogranum tailed virus 1]